MSKHIDVSGEGIYEHLVGDDNCYEGWCEGKNGVSGFPKKCRCGGLIHADFGDEDENCNYWLYLKCDKCGDDYEEINYGPPCNPLFKRKSEKG